MDPVATDQANRLGLYVRHLVGDAELPMFSRRLLELLAMPNHERTSAQKLAALVLEDYALSVNVLRVANSFHYNRSNRAIESISHAIVVLGMRTVHKLASTLIYFLAFEHRSHSLQQLMIRSMLSAHVAGAAAEIVRFPDREEVYLAGMFQNLGEVLVACQSPIQHAAIEAQIRGGVATTDACVQELGFTYDDLARAVSRKWELPPELSEVWDSEKPPGKLVAFARCGNDLTRLMCLQSSKNREAGMTLLLMRYGHSLGLTEETALDAWERAVEETRSTFSTLGLSVDALGRAAAPVE